MDPTLGFCLRQFLHRIQSSQKKFPQHFWCFRRFLCYVASHFYRIQKGQDKKRLIDPEFKVGGQRNWIQVMSNNGLLAAAGGGSVIGLSYFLLELLTIRRGSDRVLKQLLVIPISTMAGLGGSIIDSLFGATLQFNGFCSIRQKVVGKPGPTV
ncbi:hypothetical protein RYX36_023124 [Vicia faba]